MSQKYQVDNLTSRFIKCLLWDTYIPTVDIWKPGKPLVKGLTYITNDKFIVVAKKDSDGYLYRITTDESPVAGKNYYYERYGTFDSHNEEYFEIIEPYIFGNFYPGVTSNFKSNSSLYDSDTHYMLGQYLRMIRDLFDIDLMPFYNCYDGTVSDKIRIEKDKDNKDILNTDNNLNDGLLTYIIPIKYNKKYTIYTNSDTPFLIKPVYYNKITLLPVNDISTNLEIQSTRVNSCSIHSPYLFEGVQRLGEQDVNDSLNSKLLEDYLCLIIQCTQHNHMNLVVLEGNYKNTDINTINNINTLPTVFFGAENDVLKLSQETINDILKPYSSLLYRNDDNIYAFNDRLIEYLLLSPIVNKDKIKDNILRIQEYLSSNKALKEFGKVYPYKFKKDIWDNLMRLYIYNLVIKDNKNPLFLDINGFVDKDSEFIIDRGKEPRGE